ncbi:hypothetical protein Pan258_24400 [Symmachiella dynata]|uniref:YiiX/YebB-like N1pC/P60 family cysteine hydrolase n=1 Tax=Symmachiella dynata TaxID=2527995 RepID=UPI00118AF24C|nr:YiiX/YebB-like N1pC/P60 family cysteine hydrolase [Symmachiella dynata]QDT48398.1 hypothetical protein Pan258_24400 [Symmachiella dynata]
MSWILAAALLTAQPTEMPAIELTATQAAERIDALPTGTLIFSAGDCLAVRVYTQSRFTHVAAVVSDQGKMTVYDSDNGAGVRRQDLATYLKSQSPGEIHIVRPRCQFTKLQCRRFRAELEEQLGRPYSVKHHLTGNRAEGLHCAEYVMDALMAANVMTAKNPPRVSPASLHTGAHKKQTYVPELTVTVCEVTPEKGDGWCSQTWLDTKRCTKRCYLKMRGWFCCY